MTTDERLSRCKAINVGGIVFLAPSFGFDPLSGDGAGWLGD